MLFKKLNRHWTVQETQTIWKDYRARLQNEHDEFKKKYEVQRHKVEEEEKRLDQEKRAELLAYIRKMAQELNISDTANLEALNEKQLKTTVEVFQGLNEEKKE